MRKLIVLLLCAGFFNSLSGCSGPPADTAILGATIQGLIVDENNIALADVMVTEADNHVATDDQGSFSFISTTSGATGVVVVHAVRDGYAHVARRVPVADGKGLVKLIMRQADSVVAFTMPDFNQTHVLNLTHGDVSAVLTLSGKTLQNAAGTVVDGNIQATLTMWSPNELLDSSSGILRASLPDGTAADARPRYLRTYGMIDISLRQGDQDLQIIPGQTASLDIVTTAARRDGYATRVPALAAPSLWTMNPNTGLWDEDVGDAIYDPHSGILHATLRHLSTKNSDEPITTTNDEGGCMRGEVVDQCGQPVAGAAVTLQFQANLFPGVTIPVSAVSDSKGQYAVTLSPATHMGYFGVATYRNLQGVYFTTNTVNSAAQGYKPADVSMVTVGSSYPSLQLLPAAVILCSSPSGVCPDAACECYNNVDDDTCYTNFGIEPPSWCAGNDNLGEECNEVNGRNTCWRDPFGNDPYGNRCYIAYNLYEWWKNVPTGNLCQNCWPLIKLQLPLKQVPNCQSTGNANDLLNVCTSVTPNARRKGIGDLCSVIQGDVCCSADASQVLTCEDNVCVPSSDPSFVE